MQCSTGAARLNSGGVVGNSMESRNFIRIKVGKRKKKVCYNKKGV